MPSSIFVNFPGAEYTHACALAGARTALVAPDWHVVDGSAGEEASASSSAAATTTAPDGHDVYLADYDTLPFEKLLGSKAQCSSYVIRKALIRKHHLAHALHAHASKAGNKANSTTSLNSVQSLTPKTWIFELQFPDELDELLADDLYDLRDALEQAEQHGLRKWYILKPGMADRGNGIRLFDSLDTLRGILEELEGESDEEGDEEEAEGGMLSQLRHFVIQEYLSRPLLLAPPAPAPTTSSLRKFHLRAYVLCVGGLKVFLYNSMLALFAPMAYEAPAQAKDASEPDPRIHLTNTCLHADGTASADGRPAEENVHLLDDLVGVSMAAGQESRSRQTFTRDMLAHVRREAARTIGAVFEGAARGGSVHWQAWPNAWEIFGVDLLVGWDEEEPITNAPGAERLRVWLLEVNAQPDFAQSGVMLQAVIERLFARALELAVIPHAFPDRAAALLGSDEPDQQWTQGTSREGMTLCLSTQLSKAW